MVLLALALAAAPSFSQQMMKRGREEKGANVEGRQVTTLPDSNEHYVTSARTESLEDGQ